MYSSCGINNYTIAFNIEDRDSRPNIRNVKYKSPIDHLCCPICQQPFIHPLTTICGHTFCKECIIEFLKVQNQRRRRDEDEEVVGEDGLIGSCPLDRTPLDSSKVNELFPTPLIISNLVDELEVFCLNMERGCDWSGRRWELEHHVMSDCGYTGVICNGYRIQNTIEEVDQEKEKEKSGYKEDELGLKEEGDEEEEEKRENEEGTEKEEEEETEQKNELNICKLFVERRFLEEAEKEINSTSLPCLHKYFPCELCQSSITRLSKNDHLLKKCDMNYTSCKLCLNDVIPVKNITKHEENCSKMGHITCPAVEIGCDWVGNSETSLEIHLQNNNCQLNKLLPYMKNLTTKIDSLSQENNSLQRQINKILNLIIQGKITNLGYHEPMEEINKFSNELSSIENQDKLIYLNCELNRLKFELDEKILPYISRESTTEKEKENILNGLVSDNFLMKDDLNLQRALMNSLRKQLQFMLFTRNGPPSFRSGATGLSGGGFALENENSDFDFNSRSNSEERLNLKL